MVITVGNRSAISIQHQAVIALAKKCTFKRFVSGRLSAFSPSFEFCGDGVTEMVANGTLSIAQCPDETLPREFCPSEFLQCRISGHENAFERPDADALYLRSAY